MSLSGMVVAQLSGTLYNRVPYIFLCACGDQYSDYCGTFVFLF